VRALLAPWRDDACACEAMARADESANFQELEENTLANNAIFRVEIALDPKFRTQKPVSKKPMASS
jgi:hypothetical protein